MLSRPIRRVTRVVLILLGSALMSPSIATEPERIWVDATGQFSVRARLIALEDDKAVLLRNDGGETRMDISLLSERDKQYIEQYNGDPEGDENPLRMQAAVLKEIEPLPVFDLPKSAAVAAEGSTLVPARRAILALDNLPEPSELPEPLEADRSPETIEIPLAKVAVGKVAAYEICSEIYPLKRRAGPALAMSISNGYSIPGAASSSRLLRFDLDKNEMQVVWKSDETLTLMDHHHASGRSLVLIGHNPLGHGGELALAGRWHTDAVVVRHRRKIPRDPHLNRPPRVRWAKWIDEEHVIAAIDHSLAAWNIVSGEPLFRIEQIDPRSIPALSGGHRYVAVPGRTAVDLYRTDTGESLGRIGVDSGTLSSVSFSRNGAELAIASARRLRVWDLTAGSLRRDIKSRRSLGKSLTWIDSDLIMSGSGTLVSLFHGLPVWHYELTSTKSRALGDHVAIFRRRPAGELNVISVPHEAARSVIQWMDRTHVNANQDDWTLPGRSVWSDGRWEDRDVRIGQNSGIYR